MKLMCSKIMCGKYVNYMYCTFDVHLMKHAKNLIILRKHILENVQLKETHIYLMLFFTLLASFLIMNYMALKVLRKFIDCWQTFFGNWSSEVKFSENAESEVSSKCEPGLVQINIVNILLQRCVNHPNSKIFCQRCIFVEDICLNVLI